MLSWVPALPPDELYENLTVIGGFFPRADGVEPSAMPWRPSGCQAAFPRCEGPELRFHVCEAKDAVPHPTLKIFEAPATAPEATPELLFVPGLLMDRRGRRVGRGGGYYDRYLARSRPRYTVGLVRDAFLIDEIPATWLHDGDQRVDAILTESTFHPVRTSS